MAYADWMGVVQTTQEDAYAFFVFIIQAPVFALGILVFRLLDKKKIHPLATGITGFAILLALCFFQAQADRLFLVWALGFGAVAYSLGSGRFSLLVNRPICFIGLVSYSAYFWHFLVILVVERFLPGIGLLERAALVVSASLALSTVTYFVVEQPMIILGARLAKSMSAAQYIALDAQ